MFGNMFILEGIPQKIFLILLCEEKICCLVSFLILARHNIYEKMDYDKE